MGTMKKIFILHGWTNNTDKWQKALILLEEKRYEVTLLNIPGLTGDIDRPWDLNDYVDWLDKTLSKEKDKPILIGHSNGGRIAIAYSAKHPEKIKHLILIDSAGVYHNELPIRLKRFVFNNVAKIGKKLTSSDKLRNVLYKLARENDYKDANPLMRETMANVISVDITSTLDKITIPTLIIWGEQDTLTPIGDAKLMHKLIKNSKFYVVKSTRHSPQYTHPEEVVKKIEENISNL